MEETGEGRKRNGKGEPPGGFEPGATGEEAGGAPGAHPRYVSVGETAETLGISPREVREPAARGRLETEEGSVVSRPMLPLSSVQRLRRELEPSRQATKSSETEG